MNRRDFLVSSLTVPALRAQSRPPNVLFILADDLGWGDLSCYGNQRIKTPNLDAIARQGTLFSQFYVAGSVCSPSRTGFMTGRFPARYRIHGHIATEQFNAQRGMPNFLDPSAPNIARTLRQAGYETAHFGKWHLGHGQGALLPDAYGFSHHKTVTSNETRWQEQGPGFRAKSTAWMVDNTIEFLEQNRSRPFYINFWTLLPHATLEPTEEQMKPFERFRPNTREHRGAAQVYYASLNDLDTQIGRLMKRLEEMDLARNTIVLFSSDNGPEDIHISNAVHSAIGSPGPFRGRKRSLYEGGVRVPLLARWPGRIPANRVDESSVLGGVDFYPTLSKLAGLPAPAGVDGEDVSDIWTGASRPRRKPLFWEWRFNIAGYNVNRSPMLSMRDGDWKLMMNPDRSRVELYDIPRDPMELNNQAAGKPEVVARMSAALLAWQKTLPPGPVEPAAGRNDYPWPRPAQ